MKLKLSLLFWGISSDQLNNQERNENRKSCNQPSFLCHNSEIFRARPSYKLKQECHKDSLWLQHRSVFVAWSLGFMLYVSLSLNVWVSAASSYVSSSREACLHCAHFTSLFNSFFYLLSMSFHPWGPVPFFGTNGNDSFAFSLFFPLGHSFKASVIYLCAFSFIFRM